MGFFIFYTGFENMELYVTLTLSELLQFFQKRKYLQARV